MTTSQKVHWTIRSFLLVLSIVWTWEAFTCGRCWFSTYIAPLVILGIIASSAYEAGARRRRSNDH